MPPPVEKFQLTERTWGVLSLTQTPQLAEIAQNPNYGSPNSVGGVTIEDVVDPVNAQDAATKNYVDAFTFTAYQAIGMVDLANAACQTLEDWAGIDGGVVSVQSAASGAQGLARVSPGANSIRLRAAADTDGAVNNSDMLYPYKAGRTYALVTAVRFIDDPGSGNFYSWYVQYPDGDQEFITVTSSSFGPWRYYVHYYTPTVDSTVGSIGISYVRNSGDSGGTADMYIGYLQIVELANPHESLQTVELVADPGSYMAYTKWRMQTPQGKAKVGIEDTFGGDAFLVGADTNSGVEIFENFVYSWASHGAGDLTELGMEWDVGEDFVPVFLSEKDSSTAQLYAGSGFVLEIAGDVDIDCGGAP